MRIESHCFPVRDNMVRHKVFLGFTLFQIVVLSILLLQGWLTAIERNRDEVPAKRELVRHLKLTDLSLWTEARYTRHPSQADIFTPFQDFPSSLEHFPAGSIIAPENFLVSAAGKPAKP